MTLGFKTAIGHRETGFVAKIMSAMLSQPVWERGTDFDYFLSEWQQCPDKQPKLHTIRKPNPLWHPGRTIHFSTGVRTKNRRTFLVAPCTGVQQIVMRIGVVSGLLISIDGNVLSADECLTLARNDGFDSYHDFAQWFEPIVREAGGRHDFILIHWTDYRYRPRPMCYGPHHN